MTSVSGEWSDLPVRISLLGSSNSGKTHWLVQKLIKNCPFKAIWLFAPPSSLKQKGYIELARHLDKINIKKKEKDKIQLIPFSNLPNDILGDELLRIFSEDKETPRLLIFDDSLSSIEGERGNKFIQDCFTGGRHSGCSVVMMSQLLLPSGRARTTRLNSSHVVIFRFPDLRSVQMLLSQLIGKGEYDEALKCWREQIKKLGGHMTIDLTREYGEKHKDIHRLDY